MKKIVSLLLLLIMSLSIVSCGNSSSADDTDSGQATETSEVADSTDDTGTTYYAVNDTVETDIVRVTVDSAAFAIALNDDYDVYQSKDDIDTEKYSEYSAVDINGKIYYECFDENYGLPTEYIQGETYDYVAATGHTLVALTLTTENLDRASVQSAIVGISVTYNGETYECGTLYSLLNKDDDEAWTASSLSSNYVPKSSSINFYYLSQNEVGTTRLYFDIPVEVDSLSDAFVLTIPVCNSSGEYEEFDFAIN